jgi:AAA domain
MRIDKIHLANFRSHIDTTLTFDRLTVIRGVNAGGKSTIEQAIELTLAGHAEGTTADGKGSVGLIRLGEKKSLVDVYIADGENERLIQMALNGTARDVLVTNPKDLEWSDRKAEGDTRTNGEKMRDWLKLNRETISCLCNNRYFVELKEDEQKNILAAIILPKTYDWPDWLKPAMAQFKLAIDWSESPYVIIEKGYDLAFKTRTDVNREAKNHQVAAGDISEAENVEAYEERIKEREGELEQAIRASSGAKGAADARASERVQAERRRDEANARIAREGRMVADAEAKLLSKAKLAEAEKIAKGTAKAATLDDEIRQINTTLGIKREAFAKIQTLLKTPKCPTCGVDITEEHLAALASPLNAEMQALGERQDAAMQERKAIGDPAAAARRLQEHKSAEQDMERAKQRIKDDQVIVQDAESKLDTLTNVATVDTSESDAQIAELRAKIQTGKSFVQKAKEHRDLALRIKSTTARRDELQARQRDIEKLVKYFGEEVKEEMLSDSIGSFTDAMNAVLANWSYTCQISIEPYIFAILFNVPEKGMMPVALKHLSKSQRYRFSAAFQVALAIVSGFGFVIVDEADIYDSKGRAGLYESLLSDQLDQAIVIGTDERMEIPPVQNAMFYRFEDEAEKGSIPTTKVTRLVAHELHETRR